MNGNRCLGWAAIVAMAVVGLGASFANGDTYSWDGGGTTANWLTAANWVDDPTIDWSPMT